MITNLDIKKLQTIFATKDDLFYLRSELNDNMSKFKVELKGDMSKLRSELNDNMSKFKVELKGDMSKLRSELKDDMSKLKVELKTDVKELGKQIVKDITEVVSTLGEAISDADNKHKENSDILDHHERRLDRLEDSVFPTTTGS